MGTDRGAAARGHSLIELLVALVVVAILAAAAIPDFGEIYRRQRLSERMTDFANAHRLARSESVSRGRTVTLCKSAEPSAPTPSCGDDAVSWEDGWILFENTDDDLPAEVDPGEPILRAGTPLPPTLTLRGTAALEAYVSYRATGEVDAPGMLVLCERASLAHARALLVRTSGRVAVTERGADGVPLDDAGAPIDSCTPS